MLDLILRHQHIRGGHKLRTFLFQCFFHASMSSNLGAKSTSQSFSMQPKTEELVRKVRRPSKAKSASDAEGEFKRREDSRGNHSMRQSQDLEQEDAQGSEGTGRLSALNLGRTYGLGIHVLKLLRNGLRKGWSFCHCQRARTWFGEICLCCCLLSLPQLACSILATMCKP